ncbi:MAG TPA: RNA polymerase sigma factor [Acidobacteriota bacterium]|nr:RNA polymerase sigma factor [Acidobacteriota bacterium]
MSDASQRSDEELARAAKRGDAAAYDALVRRYLRPAMALACQYTRGLEDAEDVVQEAFHKTVRYLHQYDHRRSFSAWFYAIVRNTARTSLRGSANRTDVESLTSPAREPAAAQAPDPLLAGKIEQAVAALAPMQRACLRLCDVEGFTSVEAGRMLGVSEGTVRTHLHRARKQMRALIGSQKGMLS